MDDETSEVVSAPTVRRYIREGSLFRENAVGKVGL